MITQQEQAQIFHIVWTKAADAMALSDPLGNVIAANPAYYRLYGYTPDDVLGKNFAIIYPPQEREWAQKLYHTMFNGPEERGSVEIPVKRADGVELFVEASYSLVVEGVQRVAMLSIVRDVTARQKTEEALREREIKLSMALEIGKIGTWDWDIPSGAVHWSVNMQHAFGFPSQMVDYSYDTFLATVHPQDRSMVEQALRQAIEGGEEYRCSFHVITPHGQVLHVQSYGQVFFDEQNKPVRMVGVAREIENSSA